MLPPHAMVMEAALMMEIAYVTTVSMQQIAQVNFLCISDHQNMFCNLKCFVWLVECDAGQKCSGQGICGPVGACECDVGFYTEDCSSKLKIWYFVFDTFPTYCEKNCDKEFFGNLRQKSKYYFAKPIYSNRERSELFMKQSIIIFYNCNRLLWL